MSVMVIRLGALGDLVLCFQAFHEIRLHHQNERIALLTQPAFASFARVMPWFDEIITDPRPTFRELGAWRNLLGSVVRYKPKRVYDLQGRFRQNLLFFATQPFLNCEWSGSAPFCSHPRPFPPQKGAHFTDFLNDQLSSAGVPRAYPYSREWLLQEALPFPLPERYVVLIPGSSPDRLYKRWPSQKFAELSLLFKTLGYETITVGTGQDREAIEALRTINPAVTDLSEKTTLPQLTKVFSASTCVIGNDTGPTHLAGASGVPTVSLFSREVNPDWSAPRGPKVRICQGDNLERLSVDEVWRTVQTLSPLLSKPQG